MSEPVFTTPTDDELRLFAELRCRGEALRGLYLALAERSAVWIVRQDEEAAGIVFAGGGDDETYVHELFVRPPHRRNGFGSRLLEEATREARSRFATLDAADGGSQAFAIRHGAAMRGVLLQCTGAVPREDDLLRLAASEGRRFEVAPLDIGAQRFAVEALEREVRGASRPGSVPLNDGGLRQQLNLVQALAERLQDRSRPVTVQGMLLADRLLTEPWSPLYSAVSGEELAGHSDDGDIADQDGLEWFARSVQGR